MPLCYIEMKMLNFLFIMLFELSYEKNTDFFLNVNSSMKKVWYSTYYVIFHRKKP